MYDDKSYGSADDYGNRGGKTAVGVITDVSSDGSVTLMNLKNLTFNSTNNIDNFNPASPYTGSSGVANHSTSAFSSTDITGINNYNSAILSTVLGTINVTQTPPPSVYDNSSAQFNSI